MSAVMEAAMRKIQDTIQQNFKKSGGGAKFFNIGNKRGEAAELHADLNSSDKEKQKNAVKRIIANMTLGRDVSDLFVDVVKLGQTLNLELKKLVYLYILNTAKLQQESALMAVNTFLQDAQHSSPIIRALALRTMMCIRVETVTEYTLEPLRRALGDNDPYVRKTAAIGVGKLFHQNPRLFEDQGFREALTDLLSDAFPIVASNAAAVLSEVNTFGISPTSIKHAWANKLLNGLQEASEWGQVYILELLSGFTPSAEEAESLVERVLPRLSHNNSAVVLGAVKVIIANISTFTPDTQKHYLTRINSALLTLTSAAPEVQYVVFRNIKILLALHPTLLAANLESFFIRFTDPPYVKREKLSLMMQLTTQSNAVQVVNELTEYSAEVDPTFVKEVINAIGVTAHQSGGRCPTMCRVVAGPRGAAPRAYFADCRNIKEHRSQVSPGVY